MHADLLVVSLSPHTNFLQRCSQGTERPNMESAINGCARDAGMDPVQLHVCATGTLGTQLEREAAAKTDALRPPHT